MEDFYCIYTFKVVQHALLFESTLLDKGIEVKLMPSPRQISTSCGTSAKIPCDKRDEIETIILENKLLVNEFHQLEEKLSKGWFSKQFNKNKK